jgi:hypothetical protein
VVLALFAGGLFVKYPSLESARPADPDRTKPAVAGYQDVEARLWQDPLAAIGREISGRSASEKQKSVKPTSTLHTPEAVHAEINAKIGSVAILAVTLPGGSFDGAAESRRRARFAVVSALNAQGYVPEHSDALGYFVTDLSNDKEPLTVSLEVPYEWFRMDASREQEQASGGSAHFGGAWGSVLVLWLNESTLHEPDKNLVELFTMLKLENTNKAVRIPIKIIGPYESETLRKLISNNFNDIQKKKGNPRKKDLATIKDLEIFSPTATMSNCDLEAGVYAFKEGRDPGRSTLNCFMSKTLDDIGKITPLPIVRTTLTDDVLSATLIWELWHRGVNRSRAWPLSARDNGTKNPSCGEGVVLVSEMDSEYARALSRNVTEGYNKLCGGEVSSSIVQTYHYMRGLDGVPPSGDKQETKNKDQTSKEEKDELKRLRAQLEDGPKEHAEGRNQYDYLQRLISEINQLDDEKKFAQKGVKAIGVLGTDVYDKFLILAALRAQFKDKIFFTTDLDARYLHADQKDWTRNLVVASSFGLVLDPKVQNSALPFRNSYQTAIYLATRMALEKKPPNGWDSKMKDWLRPQTYEVGHTQAVHLASPSINNLIDWIGGNKPEGNLGSDWNGLKCSTPNWIDCEGIQPVPAWSLTLTPHAVWMMVVGIILIILGSRDVQKSLVSVYRWRSPEHQSQAIFVLFLLLFGILGVSFLAWVVREANTLLLQGIGEPFLWLEGVSVWPTITIRFFWLSVTIMFILAFALKLKSRAKSISDDFTLGFPNNLKLKRKKSHAIIAGPHVDLLQYDNEGKRYRIPANVTRAEESVRTLWYNYLRVTSLRESVGWIVASAIAAFLFASPLFSLFPPAFPYRGELVKPLYIILALSNVLIMWGTIFWASYEARACARLISAVNEVPRQDKWPSLPENSPENSFPASDRTRLSDYLDFRLVVRATERIQLLIYLPFISILFLVVARSDIFDAMDLPVPIIAVLVLSLIYALYSQILLRRCAMTSRDRAIRDYEEQLFEIEGSRGTTAELSAEQIQILMGRIRETKQGPFAPLSQQPFIGALLLPFGGYGGVQLIEYLMAATLTG